MKKYTKFSISGINALPRFKSENQLIPGGDEIKPLSDKVALYINIPFCKTICSFCMLRRGAKAVQEIPDQFINSLLNEISLYKDNLINAKIDSIYFGGGTPSLLYPKQFERILSRIYKEYNLEENIEITFEGEASSLRNLELLKSLKLNNVKRLSFGLQTFNEEIRRLLGRTDELHEVYEVRNKVEMLGFDELNIDYLYNLPGTDIEFIKDDLKKLKEFRPSSIDFHPLKYTSCSSHLLNDIIRLRLTPPDAHLRIDMFRFIRNWNFENDYKEQFADQYTKNDLYESSIYMQHLYGRRGGEYVGIGPGARSHFGNFGFSNTQEISKYIESINSNLKPWAKVVNAPLSDNFITCFPKRNDMLSIKEIEKSTSFKYFSNKLIQLRNNKYIVYENDSYKLTSLGLDWYQNLQEELLSESQRSAHMENVYQRGLKLDAFNGYFKTVGGIL